MDCDGNGTFPEAVNGKGNGGLLDLNTGNVRIAGYGPYNESLNVKKSWDMFAPRIGVSWQVAKNTVVRSGYGRVYGMGWSGDFFGEVLTFSYPVQVSQNLNAASNWSSVFNLASGPPAYTFAPIPSNGNFPLPDGVGVPTRPLEVRLPTLDAWNLAIQQELNKSTALQLHTSAAMASTTCLIPQTNSTLISRHLQGSARSTPSTLPIRETLSPSMTGNLISTETHRPSE